LPHYQNSVQNEDVELMKSIERIQSSQGKTLVGRERIEICLRPALMNEVHYLQPAK
jgi:hypothetical protein